MTTYTWKQMHPSADYLFSPNWIPSGGPPGANDVAEFDASTKTNISIVSAPELKIGEWLFNPGATQYNFEISWDSDLIFLGNGITINAGSVHIFNFGVLDFKNSATAGATLIDNLSITEFDGTTSAATATIHTSSAGALLTFAFNSTGGSAELITDAGGTVDFSFSTGPDGLGHVTAGSIAGAGTYALGGDQLTVGLNGLSTEASGPIEGSGGSLVKVGPGTLRLSHAGNSYSGGTTLVAGTLDVAAVGAVGPGAVTFAGHAKLEIENAALAAHVFGNAIDAFARHDILDLAGLKFHAGATATYHKANHHLTVHSGTVTDTLTLLSPHGHLFGTANDGHGGTDVLLFA